MGFTHMGARYYDPKLGRFLSPDPLETSESPYIFALDNPIMYTDPSGLTIQPSDQPTYDVTNRVDNGFYGDIEYKNGLALIPMQSGRGFYAKYAVFWPSPAMIHAQNGYIQRLRKRAAVRAEFYAREAAKAFLEGMRMMNPGIDLRENAGSTAEMVAVVEQNIVRINEAEKQQALLLQKTQAFLEQYVNDTFGEQPVDFIVAMISGVRNGIYKMARVSVGELHVVDEVATLQTEEQTVPSSEKTTGTGKGETLASSNTWFFDFSGSFPVYPVPGLAVVGPAGGVVFVRHEGRIYVFAHGGGGLTAGAGVGVSVGKMLDYSPSRAGTMFNVSMAAFLGIEGFIDFSQGSGVAGVLTTSPSLSATYEGYFLLFDFESPF